MHQSKAGCTTHGPRVVRLQTGRGGEGLLHLVEYVWHYHKSSKTPVENSDYNSSLILFGPGSEIRCTVAETSDRGDQKVEQTIRNILFTS